jgi:tetratricopeptide (TPR) repeat protein/outer membrane protein assembly factor BamB
MKMRPCPSFKSFLFVLLCAMAFAAVGRAQKVVIPDRTVTERQQAEYNARWDRLSDADKKKRNEAVKLAEEANGLVKQERMADAAAAYDRAFKQWPDLLESFLAAGLTYALAGRQSDAIPVLERYIREYDGRDIRAYRALAGAYRKTGRPGQAVFLYQHAAALDKNDLTITLDIGSAQLEAGEVETAEKTLRPLLKTLPKEPNLYLGLADIAVRKKDLAGAEQIFTAGEKNIPGNPEIAKNLSFVRTMIRMNRAADEASKKKFTEALADIDQACGLSPDYAPAFMAKGKLLIEMNKGADAAAAFLRAGEIDPSISDAWYYLGVVRQDGGDRDAAMEEFLKAEMAGSVRPDLYLRMAKIQIEKEYFDRGLKFADRGLVLDPSSVELKIAKGICHFQKTEYELAAAAFQSALDSDKANKKAQEYLAKSRAMLLVAEGNRAYDARAFGASIRKYEEALRMVPDFDDVKVNLAVALMATNKAPDALKLLLPVYQKNSNSAPVMEALASAFTRNNLPERARVLYERLEGLQKVDPSVYLRMGQRAEVNNRLDDAEAAYRKALALDPNHAASHRRLAMVFFKKAAEAGRKGDLEASLALLEQARTEDSANTDILRQIERTKALRLILQAQGQYKTNAFVPAVTLYSQAVRTDPEIAEEWFGLGQCYFRMKDLDRSGAALEQCIKLRSDFIDAYKLLAEIRRKQSRFVDGVNILADAIRISPNDAELHTSQGYLFYLNKDADNAKQSYRKAVLLDPRNPEARINLGQVSFDEGDYSAAEADFKLAVQLDPTLDDAYYNLGLAFYKQNRYDESVSAFKKSIDLNPEIPDKFFSLARTLYYMPGWLDEAVVNALKAQELNPAPRYQYGLGKIYEKKMEEARKADDESKNRASAIQAYQAVVSLAPGTQIAIWSEERLKVLMEAVRLVRVYPTHSGIKAQALRSDKVLCAVSENGVIYGFSPDAENEDGLAWVVQAGNGAVVNPSLKDGILFEADGENLSAISAADGSWKWIVSAGSGISTAVENGPQGPVVGTSDGRVMGFNTQGEMLFTWPASGSALTGRIVAEAGKIWFSDSDGLVGCLDAASGKRIWSFRAYGAISAPIHSSAGRIYAGSDDGALYAIDRETGALVWSVRLGEVGLKPVDVPGGLIVVTGSGASFVDLSGAVKWTQRFPETLTAVSMANGRGNVFLAGDKGGVFCVQSATGRIAWTYRLSSAVLAAPYLVGDDQGYFPASEGGIYQLEFVQQ